MAEVGGIAKRAVGLTEVVECFPAARERSLACMLTTRVTTARNNATGSSPATIALEGSYWTPKCSRSESRRAELEKHVHFLGKLGILPETVLVVVFQPQDDVVLSRDRQDFVDAFNDPPSPCWRLISGIALAGKDATDSAWAA